MSTDYCTKYEPNAIIEGYPVWTYEVIFFSWKWYTCNNSSKSTSCHLEMFGHSLQWLHDVTGPPLINRKFFFFKTYPNIYRSFQNFNPVNNRNRTMVWFSTVRELFDVEVDGSVVFSLNWRQLKIRYYMRREIDEHCKNVNFDVK